jgi:type III restriction enzyme
VPVRSVAIENPVINSPFDEPERHFRFDDDGITEEIVPGRRPSSYFVPIPEARRRGRQLPLDAEWTRERVEENHNINRIRGRVAVWRSGGWVGVTNTTRELLRYWTRADRERRLFYCQIEAAETAIYLSEVAAKYGDGWIENLLREQSEAHSPGLYRMAFKMATGSGKTVVMAMLIAWQTLNRQRNPHDGRFSDAFLVVTPGITIRDRLRVLYPNDAGNFYRERDILPPELIAEVQKAKIVITNFHSFLLRERGEASKLTKSVLVRGAPGAFTESPDEMVRRVARELGTKRGIVVLNDEAHHCYRRKQDTEEDRLAGEERREAERREKDARVWISGLEAVQRKIGVRNVFDLSATPFFLSGSGYAEGTLFPWVVSDFSLIDAIESGIVKVPRVPVADNAMSGDLPTYRDLWPRVRDGLPRSGRRAGEEGTEPDLPAELQGALHSLYGHYETSFRDTSTGPPPVFIVVCSNTQVSKLVFDWIGGWNKPLAGGTSVAVPGQLTLFSNVEGDRFSARPKTILVDSTQLESGEAMSEDFKKAAAVEIEEFKREYRQRFPGRDAEELTDEDLLREVMNTIGKEGKLGEHVRCVVSVSMLTEGWDANTVTHILGVRAFGTQLLCEQVIGRGLRRRSYAATRQSIEVDGKSIEIDAFSPEYAEVYGVPFSFIPCSGTTKEIKVPVTPTRVRALEDRIEREITFPRVTGYRYEAGQKRLEARFTDDSVLALTTQRVPTKTENAPIIGEKTIHTLDELKRHRDQEVAFLLAKHVLERNFKQSHGEVEAWRFPEVLAIATRWLDTCVVLKDDTFKQLLLLVQNAHDAADKIYLSIVRSQPEKTRLVPVLRPYESLGTTRWVDFDTTRPTWRTDPIKSHVSHVVADTDSWEQKTASALEDMDEVDAYVKNQGLGFTIPYTLDGKERQYFPDFIVRLKHPRTGDVVHMVLEVSGQPKRDKDAKVATARDLWMPAINAHGGFGRWGFVEVTDPWDTKRTVRAAFRAIVFGDAKPVLDLTKIEIWAKKWKVKKLEAFGSWTRDDFAPGSDVDFLVSFEDGATPGLAIVDAEEELAAAIGRDVDLVTRRAIEQSENWIRRNQILGSSRVIYGS